MKNVIVDFDVNNLTCLAVKHNTAISAPSKAEKVNSLTPLNPTESQEHGYLSFAAICYWSQSSIVPRPSTTATALTWNKIQTQDSQSVLKSFASELNLLQAKELSFQSIVHLNDPFCFRQEDTSSHTHTHDRTIQDTCIKSVTSQLGVWYIYYKRGKIDKSVKSIKFIF